MQQKAEDSLRNAQLDREDANAIIHQATEAQEVASKKSVQAALDIKAAEMGKKNLQMEMHFANDALQAINKRQQAAEDVFQKAERERNEANDAIRQAIKFRKLLPMLPKKQQ